METQEDFLIDVKSILKAKNAKLYHLLPGFIISYLKRIIHQDEMNFFLREKKHLQGVDFVNYALYDYFNIKKTVIGTEHIHKASKKLFVSNHPLGGLDGLLLISYLTSQFGPTKAIINDLLLHVKNLRPLFTGVNLYGNMSRDSIHKINELFESDNQVVLFPAGLVSRKQKGVIKDLEWKPSFLKQAKKFNREIIPIHFSGRLSSFFYSFSNLRKKIGIKKNIELIYLPDEMFKQKNKSYKITFGQTIYPDQIGTRGSFPKMAQKIKDYIYELKDNPWAQFSIS